LALAVICVPEIISALTRRRREGVLSHSQYGEAKERLATEVADATIVNLVPGVISDAIEILETNAVRAMDALHVACALQWNAELFVSSDVQQLRAAKKVGLRTKKV
jgi:predicted nucleic acid-binding protein